MTSNSNTYIIAIGLIKNIVDRIAFNISIYSINIILYKVSDNLYINKNSKAIKALKNYKVEDIFILI